ncbi:DUF2614 family zinc ribbon-containing protein [Tuberibacillus sp. Marseille-P3662]|uniref:DUF2614 family zinc ribbon-containing protein n=1 Tax=Tuberibacillus sp. Marseille-P3662 TaxID=1965358 RepID=UPI000A1C9E8C|nr:DUF2614 family zinc ribbon-containing protein [Tuberibacillus sp. Marseille-P3662]
MLKKMSKINKFRTFAMILVFAGIGIMYLALYFKSNFALMSTFMVIGFIAVILSSGIYLWVGMLSTKTIQVQCPNCGKPTKILGKVDLCMSCNEPLTVDRNLEGQPFDPKYNRRSYQKEHPHNT